MSDPSSVESSLESLYPEIAAEWSYERNPVSPSKVKPFSNLKYWWVCPLGHEYETVVARRTGQGTGCSYCAGKKAGYGNDLRTKFPKIASQWNFERNQSLAPELVTAASHKKVWWRCNEGHEWESSIANRTNLGRGCPYCSNQRVGYGNDLASSYPDIALEWNYSKNGALTPQKVMNGSKRRVWWRCRDCGHEWVAVIGARTQAGNACPSCAPTKRGLSKRTPKAGSSLADQFPGLALEWHSTLNGSLTPNTVRPGSSDKVWWKCSRDPRHRWQATIAHRTVRGQGCPYCSGRRPSADNNLAIHSPEIAQSWHPTKNGKLTPYDVTRESGKTLWWQCITDPTHEWQATPNNRSRNQGCPLCLTPKVSQVEIRLFCELRAVLQGCISKIIHSPRIKVPDGRPLSVDMLFGRVAIEYDGVYWHQRHADRDRKKTEQLEKLGYRVIRVREQGLDLIGDADISVGTRQDLHSVVLVVMYKLLALGWIPEQARKAIASYDSGRRTLADNEANRMITTLTFQRREE